METVFSRDKTGKTTVGNSTIFVPPTKTALSVLGTNTIQDGDRFAEDYWVYGPDEERRRKWFKSIPNSGGMIWPPKLDNVATLEAKRWKWRQRNQAKFLPEWHSICAKFRELGDVGGYFDNGPNAHGWVQFCLYKYGVESAGISWNWCKHHSEQKKPDVINQEFVDWYFDYEKRSRTANRRYFMIYMSFLNAVDHNFWEDFKKEDSALHLRVNGRDYWFVRAGEFDDHFFRLLASPEDTTVVTIEK